MANSTRGSAALQQLLVGLVVGVLAGAAVKVASNWHLAIIAGWTAVCAVMVAWVWLRVGRMTAAQTQAHAAEEDSQRGLTDVLLIGASLASLLALVLLLMRAGTVEGAEKFLDISVGLLSVVLSWALVHTLYAMKYARAYYAPPQGGVDFNESASPRYVDFAYLAFTIGMTFQVSDTDLKTKGIRGMALRQALLSYVFGTVIIATTINVIASLSK